MAKHKNNGAAAEASVASVSYEPQLWQMADALRGSMVVAGHKRVVFGLIFPKYVDDVMDGIERDNPALKGALPDYVRPVLDKTRLGQPVDMISTIKVHDLVATS